jgi:hypothetical protein
MLEMICKYIGTARRKKKEKLGHTKKAKKKFF